MALYQHASTRNKLLFFGVVLVVLAGSSALRHLADVPAPTDLAYWPFVGLVVTMLLATALRFWWLVVGFFAGFGLVAIALFPEGLAVPPLLALHMLAYFSAIVLCCWLLRRRYPQGLKLHRLTTDFRDFMIFTVGLSVLLGCTQALRVSLADGVAFDAAAIQRHFVASAASVIVTVPAALAWLSPPRHARRLGERRAVAEIAAILIGMLIVIAYGVVHASGDVGGIDDLPQLLLPFIVWSAVRFDYRVTTVAILLLAAYVTAQVATGVGPFVRMSADPSVQVRAAAWFIAGNGAAALLLSSFVATTRRQASDGQRARAFLSQFERAVHASFYEIDVANWRYTYIEGAIATRAFEYEGLMNDAEKFVDWVHSDDRERVGEYWGQMRNGSLTDSVDVSYQYQPRDSDVVWARSLVIPILNDAGTASKYIGITYDITEQQRLRVEQAKLRDIVRESDKLHSLGALGTGLAHNWNNLLFILSAETDELELRAGKDPASKSTIESLREVVEQGSGITGQLLGLARRDFGPFREVEPYDEVSRAVALLRRSLPTMISVVPPEPLDAPVTMKVKASYIHQIVLNLGLNARDAIGMSRGEVRFELTGPFVGDLIGPDETYIRLIVSDSGSGIAADIEPRIFEALFTTKDEQGGTGLGLAVVASLVMDMGGTVDVRSEEGEGATFVVSLPVERVVDQSIDQSIDSAPPAA